MNQINPVTATIDAKQLPKVRLTYVVGLLALWIYIFLVFLWSDYSGQDLKGNLKTDFVPWTEYINSIIMLVFWVVTARITVSKFNTRWLGFSVSFDNHTISLYTYRKGPVNLLYDNVAFVIKTYKKSYLFCNSNGLAKLIIPYYIDNQKAIDDIVEREFTVFYQDKWYNKFQYAIPYLYFAFIFTFLAARDKVVSLSICMALIVLICLVFLRSYSKLRTYGARLTSKHLIVPVVAIAMALFILAYKFFKEY